MKASDLFTLPPSLAGFAAHFQADAPPWKWLGNIAAALEAWRASELVAGSWGPKVHRAIPPGVHIEGAVQLHPTVKLPTQAVLIGPIWIGPETEIRPGAFVRGNVIVGSGCVLGTSCEYKNSLLLDRVETAHFNYVGDSILGNGAHLGAGAICSNLRLDRGPIVVRTPEGDVDTGLRKLGAILGDGAEVGCNAVLNPGAILGKGSLVMPAMAFGGCLPAETIASSRAAVSLIPRKR